MQQKLHITKNDNVYQDIHNWVLGLSNGIFRPVSCRHNGRHSRNINNINKYLSLFAEMNIKYETGNDAKGWRVWKLYQNHLISRTQGLDGYLWQNRQYRNLKGKRFPHPFCGTYRRQGLHYQR